MEPSDLPDGWELAGFGASRNEDDWHNVEQTGEYPDDRALVDADLIVLSYFDGEEVSYYTIHGGFDDDYTAEDAIADLEEEYGLG